MSRKTKSNQASHHHGPCRRLRDTGGDKCDIRLSEKCVAVLLVARKAAASAPDVASVDDKLKVVFEQLVWSFGQGLSPRKALRSSPTTASVVGSRVQEIEVISAYVNPP